MRNISHFATGDNEVASTARPRLSPATKLPPPRPPLASPFVTTFREMREMRYLWRTHISMDNPRLIAVLGKEPHTPLDEAVEATLIGLGSIAPTHMHSDATPHAA
jgi:nucleoside-diphosphate-sugar epimerase